ncbi:Proline-rich extensin-like protein EPR1 [Oopsacas minuta]|uniref:Proline-rich extensin-like protein EPR1 n=1 Tax=Oopsacas minuta TaxID=111878 RepID=A0AAV7JSB0_9METZ|nr:Proline-rich extensin-like protein EPR1 [Oopsacas minuta]
MWLVQIFLFSIILLFITKESNVQSVDTTDLDPYLHYINMTILYHADQILELFRSDNVNLPRFGQVLASCYLNISSEDVDYTHYLTDELVIVELHDLNISLFLISYAIFQFSHQGDEGDTIVNFVFYISQNSTLINATFAIDVFSRNCNLTDWKDHVTSDTISASASFSLFQLIVSASTIPQIASTTMEYISSTIVSIMSTSMSTLLSIESSIEISSTKPSSRSTLVDSVMSTASVPVTSIVPSSSSTRSLLTDSASQEVTSIIESQSLTASSVISRTILPSFTSSISIQSTIQPISSTVTIPESSSIQVLNMSSQVIVSSYLVPQQSSSAVFSTSNTPSISSTATQSVQPISTTIIPSQSTLTSILSTSQIFTQLQPTQYYLVVTFRYSPIGSDTFGINSTFIALAARFLNTMISNVVYLEYTLYFSFRIGSFAFNVIKNEFLQFSTGAIAATRIVFYITNNTAPLLAADIKRVLDVYSIEEWSDSTGLEMFSVIISLYGRKSTSFLPSSSQTTSSTSPVVNSSSLDIIQISSSVLLMTSYIISTTFRTTIPISSVSSTLVILPSLSTRIASATAPISTQSFSSSRIPTSSSMASVFNTSSSISQIFNTSRIPTTSSSIGQIFNTSRIATSSSSRVPIFNTSRIPTTSSIGQIFNTSRIPTTTSSINQIFNTSRIPTTTSSIGQIFNASRIPTTTSSIDQIFNTSRIPTTTSSINQIFNTSRIPTTTSSIGQIFNASRIPTTSSIGQIFNTSRIPTTTSSIDQIFNTSRIPTTTSSIGQIFNTSRIPTSSSSRVPIINTSSSISQTFNTSRISSTSSINQIFNTSRIPVGSSSMVPIFNTTSSIRQIFNTSRIPTTSSSMVQIFNISRIPTSSSRGPVFNNSSSIRQTFNTSRVPTSSSMVQISNTNRIPTTSSMAQIFNTSSIPISSSVSQISNTSMVPISSSMVQIFNTSSIPISSSISQISNTSMVPISSSMVQISNTSSIPVSSSISQISNSSTVPINSSMVQIFNTSTIPISSSMAEIFNTSSIPISSSISQISNTSMVPISSSMVQISNTSSIPISSSMAEIFNTSSIPISSSISQISNTSMVPISSSMAQIFNNSSIPISSSIERNISRSVDPSPIISSTFLSSISPSVTLPSSITVSPSLTPTTPPNYVTLPEFNPGIGYLLLLTLNANISNANLSEEFYVTTELQLINLYTLGIDADNSRRKRHVFNTTSRISCGIIQHLTVINHNQLKIVFFMSKEEDNSPLTFLTANTSLTTFKQLQNSDYEAILGYEFVSIAIYLGPVPSTSSVALVVGSILGCCILILIVFMIILCLYHCLHSNYIRVDRWSTKKSISYSNQDVYTNSVIKEEDELLFTDKFSEGTQTLARDFLFEIDELTKDRADYAFTLRTEPNLFSHFKTEETLTLMRGDLLQSADESDKNSQSLQGLRSVIEEERKLAKQAEDSLLQVMATNRKHMSNILEENGRSDRTAEERASAAYERSKKELGIATGVVTPSNSFESSQNSSRAHSRPKSGRSSKVVPSSDPPNMTISADTLTPKILDWTTDKHTVSSQSLSKPVHLTRYRNVRQPNIMQVSPRKGSRPSHPPPAYAPTPDTLNERQHITSHKSTPIRLVGTDGKPVQIQSSNADGVATTNTVNVLPPSNPFYSITKGNTPL